MEEGAALDPTSLRGRDENVPAKNAPIVNAPVVNAQATTISTPRPDVPGAVVPGTDTGTPPPITDTEPLPTLSTERENALPGGGIDASGARDATALPDALAGWISLTHPELLPMAVAPALITILALWGSGARLSVPLAILTLVALTCLWAGASVLISGSDALLARLSATLLPGLPASLLERSGVDDRAAVSSGLALLAIGSLCGLPVALTGGPLAWGAGLLTLVCLGLYVRFEVAVRVAAAGEVLAAAALGPLLAMAVALSQVHRVPPIAWLIGGALGLLALAVALAIDLRDAPQLQAEGRRTLVTFLSERGAAIACALCMLGGFALIALAALPLRTPHGALLAGLALPAALIAATSVLMARSGAPRQFAAREVLRLYSLVALWLAVGLIADGIVRLVLTALQVG